MRTEFGSWDIVAAKWALGLIPREALRGTATDALKAGFDSSSLRELAGELHPTLAAAGPLFEEILDEIGVSIPDRSRAGLALAKAHATHITDGSVSPYEGARQVWRIQLDVEGLLPELGPFVYWASEWREADNPTRRHSAKLPFGPRPLIWRARHD